jgi:hypothetical protein
MELISNFDVNYIENAVRTTPPRTTCIRLGIERGEQLGAADSDGAAVASYTSRTRIVVCILLPITNTYLYMDVSRKICIS